MSKPPGRASVGINNAKNKKRRKARSAKGKSARKNITKPIGEAEAVIATEDEEQVAATPIMPPKFKLRVNMRPSRKKLGKLKQAEVAKESKDSKGDKGSK